METAEDFFTNQLNQMFVTRDKVNPGSLIFNDKEGYTLIYYLKESDTLFVSNEYIWSSFMLKYNIKYSKAQRLIVELMLKNLKWKIGFAEMSDKWNIRPIYKHIKWKEKK